MQGISAEVRTIAQRRRLEATAFGLQQTGRARDCAAKAWSGRGLVLSMSRVMKLASSLNRCAPGGFGSSGR
jgi:hypothetical protein